MFCSSEVVIGHSVAWPTRHQCWSLTPEPKRNDATSRSPMSGEQHFTLVWPTAGGRVGFESFDLNQPIVVNLARGTVGTSGVVLQAPHSAKDYVPRTLGGERAPVCFLGGGGGGEGGGAKWRSSVPATSKIQAREYQHQHVGGAAASPRTEATFFQRTRW